MMLATVEPSRRSSRGENFSPDAVVERIETSIGAVHVVRDDLLTGGTKQRACAPFLRDLIERGYTSFYYASPFAGFAQVALAYVSGQTGLDCRIFSSMDPNAERACDRKHAFTRLAEDFGAEVTLAETLGEAERLALGASRLSAGAYKIPLGFDCLEFRTHLEIELRRQWSRIVTKLGAPPPRLWVPVGSGTLASVFRRIIGPETTLLCVDVRVLSRDDLRIASLAEDSSVVYRATPEKFHEVSRVATPVPSNSHYDAKLWRFIETEGRDGDLWWNVAR